MGHLRLLVPWISAVVCLPSAHFLRVRSSFEWGILEVPTALGGLLVGLVKDVLLYHSEIRFEIVHGLAQFIHFISEVSYCIFFLILRFFFLPLALSIVTVVGNCSLLSVH